MPYFLKSLFNIRHEAQLICDPRLNSQSHGASCDGAQLSFQMHLGRGSMRVRRTRATLGHMVSLRLTMNT